jgi:hypothetical protein
VNTRITITKSAGGEFELVAYGDAIIDAPVVEPESDFQIVKFFRGPQVQVIDRANVQTRWSFTVLKEWDLFTDAVAWEEDLRGKCPRVGTVMKSVRGFKGETINRFIENAGVIVKSQPRIGVATLTQVVIFGGTVLTAKPKQT